MALARLVVRALAAAAAFAALLACQVSPVEDACQAQLGLSPLQCGKVAELLLPETLPAPRGNAFGDHPAAAELGFAIFFDARFSANQEVRCASCHEPEAHFDDDEARSTQGLGVVRRNSPTLLNAAWHRDLFWDGRADSLWSQALFAFEAPNEMGFTRLGIAHRVAQSYRNAYQAIFGPLPDLDDDARFPAAGRPGDPAFDGMSLDDQRAVNEIAANVGKALEAYTRKLAAGRSRLDAWLLGDDGALSDEEQQGLKVFVQVGCIACHTGPLLSDQAYYNLGVPEPEGAPLDEGRALGARVVADNVFSLRGPFADGPPDDVPTVEALLAEAEAPESLGAFRTPSLRNLRLSPPYLHNGSLVSLEDAVRHHLEGGASSGFAGEVDPRLVSTMLDDEELDALFAFLVSLEGAYPGVPWNNWPDR